MASSSKSAAILKVVKGIADMALSDDGKKFLCGTYGNGDSRSLFDAINDQYIDPKTREKMLKKHKKKKKKKKKKGKSQNADIFKMKF